MILNPWKNNRDKIIDFNAPVEKTGMTSVVCNNPGKNRPHASADAKSRVGNLSPPRLSCSWAPEPEAKGGYRLSRARGRLSISSGSGREAKGGASLFGGLAVLAFAIGRAASPWLSRGWPPVIFGGVRRLQSLRGRSAGPPRYRPAGFLANPSSESQPPRPCGCRRL